MENFNEKLGDMMRRFREHRGLTSKEVASRLGIYPANFSNMENGKTAASAAMLFKWCAVLGMSIRTSPFERIAEIEAGGRQKFRSLPK